ncbi:MAG: hypothetical protein U5K37_08700 [Natrialbaceae archaeon]|nr:hypothetical protein [Natrialbaceae archaeon]
MVDEEKKVTEEDATNEDGTGYRTHTINTTGVRMRTKRKSWIRRLLDRVSRNR